VAFHFTLEALLRYRQSLEDRELQRLQHLLASRMALLGEREKLHQASLNLEGETKRAMMQEPTPAVEIHFAVARLEALDRQQQLIGAQLLQLEDRVAEQRSRYQQQRRHREVLEALRDAQLRDYRLRQRRREQAQLDELYLLRRKISR